jgi:23S rRNA (uracil1939-C5)-methyltransferase
MNEHIELGMKLELNIKRLGINGEGIGYLDKLAIFVDGAMPYEDVLVEITEVFPNRATAKLIEVINPSADRMEPFCKYYERCGGCQTQHISYDRTLKEKREILIKSLERYVKNKIDLNKIKPTIGADNPKNYRNKASLPVQRIKGKNYFGMYKRNSNQFIIIDDCPIQNKKINLVLNKIISLMDELKIEAFDPKIKRGYVRSLIVRNSEDKNEMQVSFVMLKKSNRLEELTKRLVEFEPSIVSVFEVMNESLKNHAFFTDHVRLIYGKETISEILGDQIFQLKPDAFFQLNTKQAEKFYQEMKRLANLKKHEIAIDAYAGIAPVSHYIASSVKEVYAIEIDKASCESARLSLELNNIHNVKVIEKDFKKALVSLKDMKVDVMFFDPPRVGLGDETIDQILKFKPKKLVYGSCNPSTLAKDLDRLLTFYEVVEIVPLDMFPYTSLVESITSLVLK